MSQGDRRVPRAIHNAETGRYAHACPDLDQEFPMEDCQGEAMARIDDMIIAAIKPGDCQGEPPYNVANMGKTWEPTPIPGARKDEQLVRCHTCHDDHKLNEDCPKGARNTYTPNGETNSLIAERETTHGSFDDNARVGQHLRWMYRQQTGWKGLDDVQREALDMIACKISRVLSGQGGFKDHWDDIAGYARLVSDRCHDPKTA